MLVVSVHHLCAEIQKYNGVDQLELYLWLPGAHTSKTILLKGDHSLVAYDNPYGKGGVDIFLAKYGKLVQREGNALITIYPDLSR